MGLWPYNVAITPDGRLALTADNGNAGASDGDVDTVSVIDLEADPPRVIDKIVVGDAPEGLAISPRGDLAVAVLLRGSAGVPRDAWFANRNGSVVALAIDGKTVTRVGEIEVGGLPEGVVFSPDGRWLYVGTYTDADVSILEVDGTRLVDSGRRFKLPGKPGSMRGTAPWSRPEGRRVRRDVPIQAALGSRGRFRLHRRARDRTRRDPPPMSSDREIFATSKAWPFVEARKVVERVRRRPPAKGFVLFETGYGPSGLPHIGTFGEVFRTTLVRRAFARLSDLPTELYAFSDDMDGLRKIPDNVPNQAMLEPFLGRPLTAIPDPFGTHESFGHHMNARLRAFLDDFGFPYTFKSATETYRSGAFDAALLRVLERHDAVREVVLPTLGPERRATYSPILPISPRTGRVLQVPILETRRDAGTVVFEDEDGRLTEVPVTGGHCKMQWKCDWAMRWAALDVDYEMSGKDLIDSVKLGTQICRILDGVPPEGFTYELFLDELGQKISKSKGNGLTIDDWLRYGTRESLALFMYRDPRAAKRLYFDVIPRQVDEYQQFLSAFPKQELKEQLGNPVWHIHDGRPPVEELPLSFAMLLNLASVVNAEEPALLWGFIGRYAPGTTPATAPRLALLVDHALAYYRDFVRPQKRHRAPDTTERAALAELAAWLERAPPRTDGETVQAELYEIGKRHGFASLRDWFKALYEVLLGQSEGPRFGSFVAVYGLAETRRLIHERLAAS